MKIKILKSQWETIGAKTGWIKTAQGRMNRDQEEQYSTTGKNPEVVLARSHALEKHKLLSAIDLAIPCLEDWVEKTGFGETHSRDLNALNALKDAVKEIDPKGYIKNAPFN